MNFQKVVCHIQGFSLKVLMGRTLAAVPCVLRASGCSPVRPLRSWYTYFQLKMNIFNTHTTTQGRVRIRQTKPRDSNARDANNEGSMKDR